MLTCSKSFTLVELVTVIIIVSVLAGLGSWLFYFFVDTFGWMPTKLNIYAVGSRALKIICDGDDVTGADFSSGVDVNVGGLRFANSIGTIEDNRIVFNDQSGNTIEIRLNDGKIQRSVNGGSFQTIPYYTPADLTISGIGGVLFTYYDDSGSQTASVSAVDRVKVSLSCSKDGENVSLESSVKIRP